MTAKNIWTPNTTIADVYNRAEEVQEGLQNVAIDIEVAVKMERYDSLAIHSERLAHATQEMIVWKGIKQHVKMAVMENNEECVQNDLAGYVMKYLVTIICDEVEGGDPKVKEIRQGIMAEVINQVVKLTVIYQARFKPVA